MSSPVPEAAGFEYQRIDEDGEIRGGFYLSFNSSECCWMLESSKILPSMVGRKWKTDLKDWEKFWPEANDSDMQDWGKIPEGKDGGQADRVWSLSLGSGLSCQEFFGTGIEYRLRLVTKIVPGLAEVAELIKKCDVALDGSEAVEEELGHQNDRMLKYLEKLRVDVANGDLNAQSYLGLALVSAPPEHRQLEEGVALVNDAALKGNANAAYNLGVFYRDGLGVSKNIEKAVHWFKNAAAKGEAMAMRNLGIMHINGDGVVQDARLGGKWLKDAAQHSDGVAMKVIGDLHLNGAAGFDKDVEKAIEWYSKGQEAGETTAFVAEAILWHKVGEFGKAVLLYMQAFLKGSTDAAYNLGLIYADPKNKLYDVKQAIDFYKSAVAADHLSSKFNLGLIYFEGKGIPKDYAMTARLWMEAAYSGHTGAMNGLADLYMQGWGLNQSTKTALAWMMVSATNKNTAALNFLQGELTQYSKEQIEEIEDEAREIMADLRNLR